MVYWGSVYFDGAWVDAWIFQSISVKVIRFVSLEDTERPDEAVAWYYIEDKAIHRQAHLEFKSLAKNDIPKGDWLIVVLIESDAWIPHFEQFKFVLNRRHPIIPFKFKYMKRSVEALVRGAGTRNHTFDV